MRIQVPVRLWRRNKKLLLVMFLAFQAIFVVILFMAFSNTIRAVIEAKVFPHIRTMEVTAYTAGPESTGKHQLHSDFGVTASTYRINIGVGEKCLAAPPDINFGTRIFVPGYGVGTVKDRGAAIVGNCLDIYFDNIGAAHQWGRQELQVVVIP